MDDSEDTAAAMAAAMGFSSFGAQNPNKRRRFNPSTDAFVASDSPSTSTAALPFHRSGDSKTATTGSNTIPLGARKQNKDEIHLDSDEDEQQPSRDAQADQQVTADNNDDDGDDPEPQYLDTSRPSAPITADPADDLQSKIDAIVGSSTDGYDLPPLSSSLAPYEGYPIHGGRGGRQHNTGRDDRPGADWWLDYYDPASIVNPWEKLEKTKGLEPVGDWVSWEEAKAAQV